MISQFLLGFLTGVFMLVGPMLSAVPGDAIDMVAYIGWLTAMVLMILLGSVNMWIREPARLRKGATKIQPIINDDKSNNTGRSTRRRSSTGSG